MKHLFQAITCLLLITACNAGKPYYGQEDTSSRSCKKEGEPSQTIYLVGDAGNPVLDGEDPVLALLESEFKRADSNSAIIFLGDNLYPDGFSVDQNPLPDKEKEKMLKTLRGLDSFNGRRYFIAGNHDWRNGSWAVRVQEAFVEDLAPASFLPDSACPGPVVRPLGEDLMGIFMDSHWYLQDHDKEQGINNNCPTTTRAQFRKKFKWLLQKHGDKQLLIAMHHPLYSNGEHGGHFSFKDHVFPLTNLVKGLYLPLPVLGSLYPLYRQTGGTEQDIAHHRYRELKKFLLEATEDREHTVFAAGHDHNLQYFHKHGQHFIVSGSGSKTAPVRQGHGAAFAHAHKGVVRLQYFVSGRLSMDVLEPGTDNRPDTVYHKVLREASERP